MGAKINTQKNPQNLKQNPKKSLDQNFTPKISHTEFPSHKNFQKAVNDNNMGNTNISNGMFVFVYSSHHLE